MKVSEIAKRCGYNFCGRDVEVTSVRYAGCAFPDSVAIIRKKEQIASTQASCILMRPDVVGTDKTIIYTADSLEVSAVKIARLLMKEAGKPEKMPVKYRCVDQYYVGERVAIHESAFVSPNVYIEDDVTIGEGCYIEPNVHIGRGCILKKNVHVGTGSAIGTKSFYHYFDDSLEEFEGAGSVVIEDNVSIGNHTTIQRGTFSDTIIGEGSKLGNLIDIGHDVVIGKDVKIVSQAGIASDVVVGDRVLICGQAAISNHVVIGDGSTVYARSMVTKNVAANQQVSGTYARDHKEVLRVQAKLYKK